MNLTLTKRIFLAILLVALLAVAATVVYKDPLVQRSFSSRAMIGQGLSEAGTDAKQGAIAAVNQARAAAEEAASAATVAAKEARAAADAAVQAAKEAVHKSK